MVTLRCLNSPKLARAIAWPLFPSLRTITTPTGRFHLSKYSIRRRGVQTKAPAHIQLINTQIRTSSKARTPIILVSIDVHEIVITPRIHALRWLKLRCSLLRPIRNARGTCQHLRRAKLHPLALASRCERPRGPGLRRERRRERKPSRDTGAGR